MRSRILNLPIIRVGFGTEKCGDDTTCNYYFNNVSTSFGTFNNANSYHWTFTHNNSQYTEDYFSENVAFEPPVGGVWTVCLRVTNSM